MKKANVIIFSVIFIAIGGMTAALYLLFLRVENLDKNLVPSRQAVIETSQESAEPTQESSAITSAITELRDYVDTKIASISGNTKTNTQIIEKTTVKESPSKTATSFITLGTSATTTQKDWATIEDSATYIDLKNDYGEGAFVDWGASLKVAHGNGQAFARLWDDTNKIAVAGSEINTTNNADFIQAQSSRLFLWNGRNLYKVQIKSLNSFEITYSNGKIKISN